MRTLANYTTPLPIPRIESALQGRAYDSYVRWILTEGLGGWWRDEWQQWSTCPDADEREQLALSMGNSSSPTNRVDETDLPLCPMAWTKPMHPLVCKYAFAAPVPALDAEVSEDDDAAATPSWMDTMRRRRRGRRGRRPSPSPPRTPGTTPPPHGDLPELADEYLERIDADKVIQKQLAMGGVRLAAILNTLLWEEAQAAEAQRGAAAATEGGSTLSTFAKSVWWPLRQRLVVLGF